MTILRTPLIAVKRGVRRIEEILTGKSTDYSYERKKDNLVNAVQNSTAHVLDMVPHTEEFDYNGDGLDKIRIEFECLKSLNLSL